MLMYGRNQHNIVITLQLNIYIYILLKSVSDGYFLLLMCMHAQLLRSFLILCHHMDYNLQAPLCPPGSPGKTTGVGCHALLQGISPTQGSNLQLLPPALQPGAITH